MVGPARCVARVARTFLSASSAAEEEPTRARMPAPYKLLPFCEEVSCRA
jgi:hypothetical protein